MRAGAQPTPHLEHGRVQHPPPLIAPAGPDRGGGGGRGACVPAGGAPLPPEWSSSADVSMMGSRLVADVGRGGGSGLGGRGLGAGLGGACTRGTRAALRPLVLGRLLAALPPLLLPAGLVASAFGRGGLALSLAGVDLSPLEPMAAAGVEGGWAVGVGGGGRASAAVVAAAEEPVLDARADVAPPPRGLHTGPASSSLPPWPAAALLLLVPEWRVAAMPFIDSDRGCRAAVGGGGAIGCRCGIVGLNHQSKACS